MFNMIRKNRVANVNFRAGGMGNNSDNSFSGCYGHKGSVEANKKTKESGTLQAVISNQVNTEFVLQDIFCKKVESLRRIWPLRLSHPA